jgi:hypothetical protein
VKTPPDQQIPPVVAEAPAQPGDGDYRVPHAGTTWGLAESSMASGWVAIVGCLGLALLMLGSVCCVLFWALASFTR